MKIIITKLTDVTMRKQTAVELLIQEIEKDQTTKAKSMFEWNQIFKQVREIEKQQIELSNSIGFEDGCRSVKGFPLSFESAEQYYNETYQTK
jgi:hypothetical protein